MKFAKDKTIAIALILLLTASAAITVGTVQFEAHALPISIPTFLFVTASPNPVGVGQVVYIGAMFSKPAPTVAGFSGDLYDKVTVDIIDPAGHKTVYGPYLTSPAAGVQFSYTPSTAGNYTIQAHYPGQVLTGTNPNVPSTAMAINLNMIGSTMLPDDSDILTLVVQENPVEPIYKTPPLPTEFWTRPIYSTNWAWGAELASNWYGIAGSGAYDASGNVLPKGTAPNSAHIVWTKPTQFGGQPGAPISSDESSQFSSTSLIQTYFKPICILSGILYYNLYGEPNSYAYPSTNIIGWEAIDVHTGEVLWDKPAGITGTEALAYGQIVNYHNFQEFGSNAILYSQPGSSGFGGTAGNWMGIYDAYTGKFLANLTNPRSTSKVIDYQSDMQGTFLGYYVSSNNLCMYNITTLLCPLDRPPAFAVNTTFFRPGWPVNGTIDGSNPAATVWKTPLPTTFNGDNISLSIAAVTPEIILMRQVPGALTYQGANNGYSYDAAYNARTGALLWGPTNQTGIWPAYEDVSLLCAREGYYVMHNKDRDQAYGFDLKTGKKLWGPVQLPGSGYSSVWRDGEIAYGKVYIWDLGGYVNAIDLATGKIAWTFYAGDAGYDTPFGSYPFMGYNAHSIADGKLFLSTGHMYTPPLHPAYRFVINCTDGSLVWKALQYSSTCIGAIGDGYLISWNSFDNQIYSFGKGPTATTITAPDTAQSAGTQVLVQGTVMDTSGGTKQKVCTTRFPNGVPAVSDDSMEAWMEYVYMQQIRPANATGVEVSLDAIDPNNNFVHLGTATSDTSGNFGYAWTTPDVPGKYTIIATFAGSESYYASYAETYTVVSAAPAPAVAAPEPAPNPPYEMYTIGTGIAIIIAIAIAVVLILRKK